MLGMLVTSEWGWPYPPGLSDHRSHRPTGLQLALVVDVPAVSLPDKNLVGISSLRCCVTPLANKRNTAKSLGRSSDLEPCLPALDHKRGAV
jgi:hypothetical protein